MQPPTGSYHNVCFVRVKEVKNGIAGIRFDVELMSSFTLKE